jgi:protease I
MTAIQNAKILILATNGFEQSELEVPRDELRRKGAEVRLATPDGQDIKGWDKRNWGRPAKADLKVDDVQMEDYDALILPGGVINPDKLRTEPKAVQIVKDFFAAGKIVAAICHGPWMLVEADVARGRRMTSYKSVRTDVKNAGADWVDEEVVVDQGIVTSRSPADLPAFVKKIAEEIGEGKHTRREAAE